MKATSEQILMAASTILAGILAHDCHGDISNVNYYADISVKAAKKMADVIPDDKPKQSKYNTGNLFKNFPWKDGGVTRTEMETWLKMHSGYTSNRAMQTIINNAIAEGVTHKDIHLGKYMPGPDNSHA